MGHVMQPVIARLWEEAHQQRLKEYDVAGTHPRETWLRSHFDYITEDNKVLVECKNYNLAAMSKYSEPGEPVRIPDADLAQCIHEAAVAGVVRLEKAGKIRINPRALETQPVSSY
jgi:hypothetical protein